MIEMLNAETLSVISVNIWQILISLANLLIIFLILKKLLWKPVQNVLKQRQEMVEKQFADADAAKEQANADKAYWAEKLSTADDEAADFVPSARTKALQRRIDDQRKSIHKQLLGSQICFFGANYAPVSVPSRLARQLLDILPEAMRDATDGADLLARLRLPANTVLGREKRAQIEALLQHVNGRIKFFVESRGIGDKTEAEPRKLAQEQVFPLNSVKIRHI